MPDGPMTPVRSRMRRVATLFNNSEYEKILKYAKRKGLSIYALVKRSVREFIERHP